MGKKTVWILGAGFSRPLGGPLLYDLLAPKGGQTLRDQMLALGGENLQIGNPPTRDDLKHHSLDEAINGIQRICRGFQAHRRAGSNSPGFWGDAEEFLDLLETVCLSEDPVSVHGEPIALAGLAQIQRAFPEKDLHYLARAARQAIAFDCSVFLQGANVNSEKWQPFREWSQKLNEDDTIVTFNYDLIPERLANAGGSRLLVHPPRCNVDRCTICRTAYDRGKAHVFKVHGSVNWRMKGAVVETMPAESDFFLDSTDPEIVMGIPGPQKQRIATEVLSTLWNKSMERVREADTIIFAGYRFPPSDALARRDLLTAIRDNESKDLKVVTVLGPNNPDENRLVNLIETAFGSPTQRNGKIRQRISKPLYIQDFLSLLELVGIESVIPSGDG